MCKAATEMLLLCLMADVDSNDGVPRSSRPSCAHCVLNWANPNASSYPGELILGALCHPFHRRRSLFAARQISEEMSSSLCRKSPLPLSCWPNLTVTVCDAFAGTGCDWRPEFVSAVELIRPHRGLFVRRMTSGSSYQTCDTVRALI